MHEILGTDADSQERRTLLSRHKVGRLALVWATAAAVLAGCSGAPETESGTESSQRLVTTKPAVPSVESAPTARDLTLPIEAYIPTAEQRSVISKALHVLVQRCASQFGFDYSTQSPEWDPQDQMARRYGIMYMENAKRYGYNLPPEMGGKAKSQRAPGPGGMKSMSKAKRLVLYGSVRPTPPGKSPQKSPGTHAGRSIPAGGCFGQARRKLGVNQIDPSHLAESIGVQMHQRAETDSRVVAVIDKWSACMAQHGYEVESPMKAGTAKKFRDPQASSAEITQAVQDVRCKKKTNLIGVWFSVESAYQKKAIQKKLPALTGIMTKWNEATRQAAKMLGVPVPEGR